MRSVPLTSGLSIYAAMTNSSKSMLSGKAEIARLCQSGRFADALRICEPLCTEHPGDPELWFLSGAIHGALGDFARAETCCRKALTQAPGQPMLHYNLGIALLRQERPAEARAAFQTAVDLRPDYPEALTGLGDASFRAGEFNDAVRFYRKSLSIAGNQPQTFHNLALAAMQTADQSNAEQYFEQATALAPAMETAWIGWSRFLLGKGNSGRAIAILEKAISQLPDSADLRYQHGYAKHHAGRYEEAMTSFGHCLRLVSRHRDALFARSMLLRQLGRLSDAMQDLRALIETDPRDARAHAGLAGLYKDEGRINDALAHGRKAVELDPGNAEFHGNLIMNMHYGEGIAPSEVFDAHRAWGLAHAASAHKSTRLVNSPDPERALRIGYFSPDFKEHSVAYFIAPILAHHNRARCTVFCYSNLPPEREDPMTEQLRVRADVWREISAMTDDDAAALVGADGIDILVDLAGHTAGNRLGVFARRAAPVQMTWIGYPGTTGVPAMDYRLTDAVADPDPNADRNYTEKLLRIPQGFLCYAPPPKTPEPAPPPHESKGFVTFGSFNNLAKLNDSLMRWWAAILDAIPDSRLVLKAGALADDTVRARIHASFSRLGIDIRRIELLSWVPTAAGHLGHYGQVDVALDTFPYNGTTTTCEALWMGVPVVTRSGMTHASRVGASLLSNIGLSELIADTADRYVEVAVALAHDLSRMRELRKTLRDRMRGSPVMDGRGFCDRLETCYRDAWWRWCSNQKAPQDS